MKKKGRSEGIIFLLACLVWGGGCSVRKEQTSARRFGQTDSLVIRRLDSLQAGRLWKSAGYTSIRWEKVDFSAPDSTGRQHIEQISRGRADSREKKMLQDTLKLQSRQETHYDREQVATEQLQSTGKKQLFPFRQIIGAMVLLLLVWGIGRFRR